MARIVVLGGGFCGLAAGLMLARDDHEVTVLERDPEPVPTSVDDAWERWPRDGVTQFRLAHFLAPGGRAVLEEELPDVLRGLVEAGGCRYDAIEKLPPTVSDQKRRPGDERFATVTARRPVMEQVLGGVAEREPALEVRRGSAVGGLIVELEQGLPHVSGVRLDTGETLTADLVVDAMGRRSRLPRWLENAGVGPIEEEVEDSGFIYYGRYFSSPDGSTPPLYAPPLCPLGSFSILSLPADNGTWAVGFVTATGDKPLKELRHTDRWETVLRACPAHAHLLDGEPISEILAMGGLVDRYRRLAPEGQPLLTGVALLGDAFSCTNPSLGRGISLGLMHARSLRDTIASIDGDPLAFAEAWDLATETKHTPWYRDTLDEDRARLDEMEAIREQRDPRAPTDATVGRNALITAAMTDADLFRTYLETRVCLTTVADSLADPAVAARVFELAAGKTPFAFPAPDREQLIGLLGGS
ncbi:MAG TPA: NAD(P)-binding protein [Solirubrobacteraceae bacterium]|jgi:2-polyprenyl-6-methoxyphenol hydroxylase-like FAD-dependent oxidoreductase